MINLPRFTALLFAATLSGATLAATQTLADTLRVHGSTTFSRQIMEPLQAQIEALSGHRLQVVPNKTLRGLLSLIEGRADMAMISAPLENELSDLASVKSSVVQNLRVHPITATRIAVGVHASNLVRRASLAQLTKVLKGEITNWSELGGGDAPIRVAVVGEGGGVTTTLEAVMLKGEKITISNLLYVRTPVQLAWVIEQESKAIAFGQLALFEQRKIPQIDTDEPIIQPLNLVTLGEPTTVMMAVIAASRRVTAGQ